MKSRPIFSRPFLLFILILALSSQACALSLIELPTQTANTPVPGGPAPTPAPRAQVTFTVRLPEPLLPNEVLMFSVLDEITGLALKIGRAHV